MIVMLIVAYVVIYDTETNQSDARVTELSVNEETEQLPIKTLEKDQERMNDRDESRSVDTSAVEPVKADTNTGLTHNVDIAKVPESMQLEPDQETNNTSADQSELAFYFNEDSWVEVTDAEDKRLLFRLGKAGMSQTVTGVAPFRVRLGYVNGASIMYNGEPYDLSPFSNRRSARFIVGNVGDQMSKSQ